MEEDTYGSSADSYLSPAHTSSPGASEPISAATTPPSASSRNFDDAKAIEAHAFFSDLSNYLGVGCLVFREFLADAERLTTSNWQEVSQLPLLPAFDGSIYAHVQGLVAAGWIKVLWSPSVEDPQFQLYRVYVLPFDTGHRFVDRRSKVLSSSLENLIIRLNVSADVWNGRCKSDETAESDRFDPWATREDGSLFWLFNKIPSPRPQAELVQERYAREALEDLLDPDQALPGLKTLLYPYQRRSAGLMLQRESTSKLELDPRLEARTSPDGTMYYYSARDCTILRQPRYYEACKGGILADSMGYGKTLMCLALILATKKHLPKIPPNWNKPVSRPSVGSLASMAISSINRKSVPWQVEFERIASATGDDMNGCRQKLEADPPAYEIIKEPQRWNRATVIPPAERMVLAATTLVVVPHNLLRQWQNELKKHIEEGVLDVLTMEDSKKPLPDPNELRKYDIVLFTRKRFEQETRDGSDGQGRRMGTTQRLCRCPYIGNTRTRNCTCLRTDDLYDSPLKHLHFLRIIIDEGHFFHNSSGIAASVAEKLLKVDHRWVVSGTPAKDLLGVEVDMSASENLWRTPATADSREAVLQQRRHFSEHDRTGAIKSLGSLASVFLKIRPWAASEESNEPRAEWDEYVFRHEGFKSRKTRTFSGFSSGLRRTLEGMVIKTQPDDVERDIDLPPLTHEIIRLEPSFYDKLTANLFTLVLTANAVTSERTDQDYLFHKNSAKARYQLVANLRQSAFFWTGFSEGDIQASVDRSTKYLEKEHTSCLPEDRQLLVSCLQTAKTVLQSNGWKSMSRSHELGIFVDDWPINSRDHWAFDKSRQPLLTGISNLLEAQRHVHEQVGEEDPGAGMAGAGIKAVASTKMQPEVKQEASGKDGEKKAVLTKAGIPTSSLDGEPTLKRRASLGNKGGISPMKKSPKVFKVTKPGKRETQKATKRRPSPTYEQTPESTTDTAAHNTATGGNLAESLPADSPFLASRIVGTTSAKLSYLVSEILKYYHTEKILVFYDGDNAAYYIAQMLDLLHIKHEIYAKSLKAAQKSEYAVRFDQETQDRVLLMDVRQAAFGLNLPAASRIYFVNPVCRENIEAQAIKRAHRIGQTKAVHVETLVLKGTIEEKMLDRSKRMTRAEHLNASHLEDDGKIKQIIQSAAPLPVQEAENLGREQMAPLDAPQQVWCREGWREYYLTSRPGQSKKRKAKSEANADGGGAAPESKRQKKKKAARRTLAYVDCTGRGEATSSASGQYEVVDESEDDLPLSQRRRFGAEGPKTPQMVLALASQGHQATESSRAAVKQEGSDDASPSAASVFTPYAIASQAHDASSSSQAEPHSHGRMSISSLLSGGQEGMSGGTMNSYARNDLVQDILQRL